MLPMVLSVVTIRPIFKDYLLFDDGKMFWL